VAGVRDCYLYPGVGSLGAAYVDLTAAPVVLDCVREYVDEDLLQSLVIGERVQLRELGVIGP